MKGFGLSAEEPQRPPCGEQPDSAPRAQERARCDLSTRLSHPVSSGSGPLPWGARSGQASQSHFLAVAGRSVAESGTRRDVSPGVLPRSSPLVGNVPSPGSEDFPIRQTSRAGDAGRRPRVRAEDLSLRSVNTPGRSAAREVAGGRTRPSQSRGNDVLRIDSYVARTTFGRMRLTGPLPIGVTWPSASISSDGPS